MSAKIIDGRALAGKLMKELTQSIDNSGKKPGLAVILIGSDPASVSYVNSKERDCEKVGIVSRDIRLADDVPQDELLRIIQEQNESSDIHGILVQLPLPAHMNENLVMERISPDKDVDGFHPVNMGRLALNMDGFLPCTPYGILKMLESEGVTASGKDVVIVGRSRIVGTPLANLFFRRASGGNATVTVCHTRTSNLSEKTRRADIIVAAAGCPGMIKADMVKEGAVVIDVGVNRVDDPSKPRGYRLTGDVDYQGVKERASLITPVPGGVGPLTRTMLLYNTVKSAIHFH